MEVMNSDALFQDRKGEKMKTIKQLILSSVIITSMAFTQDNEAQFQSGVAYNTAPVGSIITSVLSWEDFQTLNPNLAGNYLPCDGRDVPANAKYYDAEKRKIVPDLRGLFIHGVNQMDPNKTTKVSDDKKNPEDKKAGEFQKQDWKSFYVSSQEAEPGNYTHQPVLVPKVGINENSRSTNNFSGHWLGNNATVMKYKWDDSSEIRPRNMSVYYYIKIN